MNIRKNIIISAITRLTLTISCFSIMNSAFGKLESEIFKYPNPEEAKNIEVTFRGKTKSGKKWIAFSINQLSKLGKNPLSEMKKLPKKLTAGDQLDLSKEENMEKYIKLWNKNCKEGYPYGGLFIYTDDDSNNRKLIGLAAFNISEKRTDEMEFSISMLLEYQPKDDSEYLFYKIESDDNYRTSILEGILEYGNEISKVLQDPKKFSITQSNKENDEKVNSQIRDRFSFNRMINSKILRCPLAGFSSTCTLEDNWLEPHMEPYPYKAIPHIIADFRIVPLTTYFEQIPTKKEFLKIVSKIIPIDNELYSIYMPERNLLTVNRAGFDLSKNIDSNPVNAWYFKRYYTDFIMIDTPIITKPVIISSGILD